MPAAQTTSLVQFLAFSSSSGPSSTSSSACSTPAASGAAPTDGLVSPRMLASSTKCCTPGVVIGAATSQGGRPYMEDCHAVHIIQLPPGQPPSCAHNDGTDAAAPAASPPPPPPPPPPADGWQAHQHQGDNHTQPPGHDSDEDCNTPSHNLCTCLPDFMASCGRRLSGKHSATDHVNHPASATAAGPARTSCSIASTSTPSGCDAPTPKLMPQSPTAGMGPAANSMAIASGGTSMAGACEGSEKLEPELTAGSLGALEVRRPAKRPRLPTAPVVSGLGPHLWDSIAPDAAAAATHGEPLLASNSAHHAVRSTTATTTHEPGAPAAGAAAAAAAAAAGEVCRCELQPALHAGEQVLCAQVYDGHGGMETARYAALHMVDFVAHACQRQLEAAAATPAGPTTTTTALTTLPTTTNDNSNNGMTDGSAGGAGPTCTSSQPFAEAPAAAGSSCHCLSPAQLQQALQYAFTSFDSSLANWANAAQLYHLSEPHPRCSSSTPTITTSVPRWYGRWWTGGDDSEAAEFIGPSAGSTAVVALLSRQLLTVAGLGDSKAWVCMARGQGLQPLCVEHKATEEAELARITRAGGWVSRSGRVNSDLDMSRALGDMEFKQAKHLAAHEQAVIAVPDVRSVDLSCAPGSTWLYVLLATDGLSNACSEAQIHEAVIQQLDAGCLEPATICQRLCDMACDAERCEPGGPTGADNVTALLILPASSAH